MRYGKGKPGDDTGVIVADEDLHGSEQDRTDSHGRNLRIRSPRCRWG